MKSKAKRGIFRETYLVWENKNYTTTDSAARHPSFSRFLALPPLSPQRSIPIAAAASSGKNTDFQQYSGRDSATKRVKLSPLPSWLLANCVGSTLPHIVLQEIRRLLPLWGSCSPPPTSPPPPRSSTPLPSIVVLISCSRAKDNVTTRKTPCCLHV